MSFGSWLNLKVKELDWLDIALVKLSCVAFGVLLVVLIPKLVEINVWWIVAVVILLAERPAYRVLKTLGK